MEVGAIRSGTMVRRIRWNLKNRKKCWGRTDPFESTFQRTLDAPTPKKTRTERIGFGPTAIRESWRFASSALALVLAVVTSVTHSGEVTQTSCLSLSPFRAVSLVRGSAPGSGEALRDQVLSELKRATDSSWNFQAAGGCPQGLAVLDVFQKNEDLVSTPQGNSLRFRLEWRQIPGMTEFFLPLPAKQLPSPVAIAEQLRAVANQMLARVEVGSVPDSVSFKVVSAGGRIPVQITPMRIVVPPGPLSLEFQYQDLTRRQDTLVGSGGLYEVQVNFTPTRVVLPATVLPAKVVRRTWPAWAAAGLALVGSAWTTYQQERAQKAYSSLGANSPSGAFDQKWSDLRDANRVRNACLGATVILAGGAGWLEWSSAH